MSKPDTSIDPRILESAKEEFLAQGFEQASLQVICQNAGVTTGALYRRYSGKLELFNTLIAPVLKEIDGLFYSVEAGNYRLMDDNSLQTVWEMSEETHESWINFFYDRYDDMRLLLCCAAGTPHSDFIHSVVDRNTKQCLIFLAEMKRRNLPANEIEEDELHILLSAYWTSILETIIHGFSREKALRYVRTLTVFFNWKEIFGF